MGTQRKDGLEKLNIEQLFTATGVVGRPSTDPYDISSVNQIRALVEGVGVGNAVEVYGRIRHATNYSLLATLTGTTGETIDTSLVDEIYFTCTTYSASGAPRLVASGFFNRAAGGGGGGGEANTASNLGAGSGVFASKSGVDLRFKSLVAGTNVTISSTATEITINASGGGGGISTLNTLTASSQSFATGTSGTDFAISSATSTHTFNLPVASGTNTGKLSSTDWTTFNNKVGTTRTISTTSPLSGGGDLSANRTLAVGGLSSIGTANYAVGVNSAGTAWEYKQLIAGTNVTITHGAGSITIAASGGGGGAPTDASYLVLGANATLTNERTFIVASPLTTTDAGAGSTYEVGFTSQTANIVFAGPSSGGAVAPTFRSLVANDIPSLTAAKISDFAEAVDDEVAALLVAGTNITLTYNDVANTLTIAASGGGGGGTGLASAGTVSVTGNRTFVTGDAGKVLLVDTTAARTLTLPSTVAADGWNVIVKDISGQADTNNITIARGASESIEGVAANYVCRAPNGVWRIYSNGTNYFFI